MNVTIWRIVFLIERDVRITIFIYLDMFIDSVLMTIQDMHLMMSDVGINIL
jgi:hypothetical protein